MYLAEWAVRWRTPGPELSLWPSSGAYSVSVAEHLDLQTQHHIYDKYTNLCRWSRSHLCSWSHSHQCRWICPPPLLLLWSSVRDEGRRVAADSQTSASSIGRHPPPPPPPLLRWWAPSAEKDGYRQEVTCSLTNSPECKDVHLRPYKIHSIFSVFTISIFGNPIFLPFTLILVPKTVCL